MVKNNDKDLPTVLFTVIMMYNRQTNGTLDFSPFEPINKLFIQKDHFARGACDDKGQMYMHVKAFEYMIKAILYLAT
jgi:hypothetical protein